MNIRLETPSDRAEIYALTQAAFATMPFSNGTEGPIIDALRADGDLFLSLVAKDQGELIGHIAFSPVTVSGERDGLYGLGPVSVRPDRQRQGIGSALIRDGIARLIGAKAIFLIGDPAYYGRFGFRGDIALTHGDVPQAYVQGLFLDGQYRTGEIHYAPGFSADRTT